MDGRRTAQLIHPVPQGLLFLHPPALPKAEPYTWQAPSSSPCLQGAVLGPLKLSKEVSTKASSSKGADAPDLFHSTKTSVGLVISHEQQGWDQGKGPS